MFTDSRSNALVFTAAIILTFVFGVWVGMGTVPPPSKTDYRVAVKPVLSAEPKEGRNETLGSGFVRVINTDQMLVVYETDYGFIKTFEPYCFPRAVPMWVGMRLYQLNFRWVGGTSDTNACYAFDYIGHAASGDLELTMVPKK